MPTIQAAMSGVPIALITALTTGTSSAIAIPSSFRHHNFMITAASGVTSGAVTIETSNDAADSGTWAAIVPDKSVANPLTVAVADLLMAYSGLLNFVRARISTTIAGGSGPSVTVTYEGAKSY
jgi:hypothetical protein